MWDTRRVFGELREPNALSQGVMADWDVAPVRAYLEALVPVVLDARLEDVRASFASSDGAWTLVAASFVQDASEAVAFVDQIVQDDGRTRYMLARSPTWLPTHASQLALVKRHAVLDVHTPLAAQLRVVTLLGPRTSEAENAQFVETPYEAIEHVVDSVMEPWVDAYAAGQGDEPRDDDGKTSLPLVRRKLAELKMSLRHAQQHVDIPHVELRIHPAIHEACERAGPECGVEAIEPQSLLHNDAFINALHAEMNGWVRAVQTITRLDRDPTSGTAAQETNFWAAMEHALEDLERQLHAREVTLTLDVLTGAKRFHATVSFHADTGLKDCLEKVHGYNVLLKDLPLDELHAATSLDALEEAQRTVFTMLLKKLRISTYPVRRALAFVDALGRDVHAVLLKILAHSPLMEQDYDTFMATHAAVERVMGGWDEHVKEFVYVARDLTRKRSEKFIPIKVAAPHSALRARLDYLARVRRTHEELVDMVCVGRDAHDAATKQALQDIQSAFHALHGVDVLDASEQGTAALTSAEAVYHERIAHVESRLIERLRRMLNDAHSARERLRILAHFNALYGRPRVRAAVQEYQAVLLQSVRADLDALRTKFQAGYRHSDAHLAAQLRNEPEIVGAVIWVGEMERQVHAYMQRVQDALGAGWADHVEGQRLYEESEAFLPQLDTRPLVNAWAQDMGRRAVLPRGPVLHVVQNRENGELRLVPNYDAHALALAEEAHALAMRGVSIPHALASMAQDAERIAPFATALDSALHTLEKVHDQLTAHAFVAPLLAQQRLDVRAQLRRVGTCRWERFLDGATVHENPQADAVDALIRAVVQLEASAVYASEMDEQLSKSIDALRTCAYTSTDVRSVLDTLQSIVDGAAQRSFSNQHAFVQELNSRLDDVLVRRIDDALATFTAALSGSLDEPERPLSLALDTPIVHIVVRTQTLRVEPPLEQVRAHWFGMLGTWLDAMLNQPRVHVAQRTLELQDRPVDTHAHLLDHVPHSVLQGPLQCIEAALADAGDYAMRWLELQALWDMEPDSAAPPPEDMDAWLTLMEKMRATRSFVDAAPRHTGALVHVDAAPAQMRVAARLDVWKAALQAQWANAVSTAMHAVHTRLERGRAELEPLSATHPSTQHIVSLVTRAAALQRELRAADAQVQQLVAAEAALRAQRFRWPADWLYAEQVQSAWTAAHELLAQKQAALDAQHASVQVRLANETRGVQAQVDALSEAWARERPTGGSVRADDALRVLGEYKRRVRTQQEAQRMLADAREVFGLGAMDGAPLAAMADEIEALADVWQSLARISGGLDELKRTPWRDVHVRTVRQRLDTLTRECRALPTRMRTYDAYEAVHDELQFLSANARILGDLKADAFQSRHWRALHAQVGAPRYVPSTHTLGTVWGLDWRTNLAAIRSAIDTAQGEYALDVYLQQVREAWTGYALELVDYRHECMLVRGWDALFAQAAEHAAGLRAMSASAHYRVFEDEARSWEERVARIHTVFDRWADVQRQWVHLHGVFGSGNDAMSHVLPVESARFQSISSEFLSLLRRVLRAPYVLDVIAVPGIRASLERLTELLHRIQTALGAFLEQERARFPRFYFVGDDDLLEMLGHGRDVHQTARHLPKMFAGLATVHTERSAIVSVETTANERVTLATPVPVRDDMPAHEWLALLERSVRETLAQNLPPVLTALESLALKPADMSAWLASAPAQLLVLATQIAWARRVERAKGVLEPVLNWLHSFLHVLAEVAAGDTALRAPAEQLIALGTHHAGVVEQLSTSTPFAWEAQLRHYLEDGRVVVRMAYEEFEYGFEPLGLTERLVQTPLTTACYSALTHALACRRGGAPFGPAGTGKTETVKALGAELGRFVLVFNCDSQFDLRAMRRLFVGLCRVGAWGCFDEFNRLDEHVLSSVSQQIQAIQHAAAANTDADLGTRVPVHTSTGIFVTMNPTYAGRSHLPDNLVKLFVRVAMSRPDAELIVHVLLRVHGFKTAAALAGKIVLFFRLCAEQLSDAPHYDFGLRALKAVLVRAANVRREQPEGDEARAIVQSIHDTVPPRLVADDVPLLSELVADVFPDIAPAPVALGDLHAALRAECEARHLSPAGAWLDKVIQLYQIVQVAHGVVLVGDAGVGKTMAWRVLLAALARVEHREGVAHVLDPKVMSKDALYGTLDPTTREWTDGLFTHILRRIVENERRERTQRHWIVFDGDLDPEWVETLNSVLDDNRQLTLPTGERLALPENVRLLFEVDSVAHATHATITRCGLVWFPNDAVSVRMRLDNTLASLRLLPVVDDPAASTTAAAAHAVAAHVADAVGPYMSEGALVEQVLSAAHSLPHCMTWSDARAIAALGALLRRAVRDVLAYNARHPDFSLTLEDTALFARKAFVLALLWAVSGDASHDAREDMGRIVAQHADVDLPDMPLPDAYVEAAPGTPYRAWSGRVANVEVDARALTTSDTVVPTTDTVRHEALVHAWLHDERPVVLCGPPGSGKTMVVLAALRRLPDVDVVTLNLSSQTTPHTLLRTLEAHAVYEHTPAGMRLVPRVPGRRLALFCDEINLPAPDRYATQSALALLRQWIEHRGFWRHRVWVALERIQVVGACNPPTDAGRTPLPPRFLRHVPVVWVPHPSDAALLQIYSTLNRAMLRRIPPLLGYADACASAMLAFFRTTQQHFTPAQHAHYVYSPRELTRWVRGMHAILPEDATRDELVRVWAHEAQRVFQDRLVTREDKTWSDNALDDAASAAFPGVDVPVVLRRPLLYSDWLARECRSVEREPLREYARARLHGFADEALETDMVLHDAVLDLALRCDRVLQQPAGHLLLIGVAGSGRTTVARFCAWLRGLALYSVPSARTYDEAHFDDDLRALLRRVGVRGERVCWTLDESQVAVPARVEKLNTLLANAEVAGLFEGDEYASLLSALRDTAQREGLVLDSDDELLAFFRAQIMTNLHVVLTMTPPRGDMARRAAASPALLNRCTLVYCWT